MSFEIPTITQLTDNSLKEFQQGLAELAAKYGVVDVHPVDAQIAKSNNEVKAFATGASLYGAYRYLRDVVIEQAIPTKAIGKYLDGWLQAYGMKRKPATVASGSATNDTPDVNTPHAILEQGSVLQDENGNSYVVKTDAEVATDGSLTISIAAQNAGLASNLAAGKKLTLQVTHDGIASTFTVGADGISGGVNRESDEEAAERLHQRLANPPMGGAPHDYERWARECPGITRAWGIRNPAGPTSAGVVIMADANTPYGLPTLAQKQAVIDYISDTQRGPSDELFVIIPTVKAINIVLDLTPDTAAIRDAVKLELQDLFFRVGSPNSTLWHTALTEAVATATGETTHIFVTPPIVAGGLITSSWDEILVLGTVDFV